MRCWKCGNETGEKAGRGLAFRAECPNCKIDLHCCRQCVYYSPGRPNDCAVPGTEKVMDREKMNFCEEFTGMEAPPQKPKISKEDIEKRLFGD
ncbi:MAG: hypothetical protein WC222_06390 [Parachlamydiales bacterium]